MARPKKNSDNPTTPVAKINKYLIDYCLDSIYSTDINNAYSTLESFKDKIIESKIVTADEWNSEYPTAFIKALLILKYLSDKDSHKEFYNSLIKKRNKKEIQALFEENKDLLDQNYMPSSNICTSLNFIIKNEVITIENLQKNTLNVPNPEKINKTADKCNIEKKDDIKVVDYMELNCLIKKDSKFEEILLSSTDKDIHKEILNRFKDTAGITSELIDTWISKVKNKKIIKEGFEAEMKKITILTNDLNKSINDLTVENTTLSSKVDELNELNKELSLSLDSIKKQYEKLKASLTDSESSADTRIKNIFNIELKELNKLMTANSSESHIVIKDSILTRVSKYIDMHHLIDIEDVISNNRDLKSQMVQIILLAFIHENSLL